MTYRLVGVIALMAVGCGGDDDDDAVTPDAAAAVDAPTSAIDAPAQDAAVVDGASADAPGLDAAGPDAAGPDAAGPDAAGADAAVADASGIDGPACAAALNPLDDGTGVGTFDVVISEVKVDDYIELFNRTASDVDLTTLTAHRWCAYPDYPLVSASSVTVPAGGYATVPWPVLGPPTDANGELVLYANDSFSLASAVLDYVCWGGSMTVRKGTAEAAGKWSGDCVSSIPAGGSLHRKPGTTGTSAADYEPNGINTPMNCVP